MDKTQTAPERIWLSEGELVYNLVDDETRWENGKRPQINQYMIRFDRQPSASGSDDELQSIQEFVVSALSQQATIDALTAKVAALEGRSELMDYVLQHELHNRLTPRIVDIAYSAFMNARRPNSDDGGRTDWFTDTKPMVDREIANIRAALASPTAIEGET